MSKAEQRAGVHGHLVCLACPTAPEGSKRFISIDPHEMGDESDSWMITLHHFHKKLKHLHENHPRSVKCPQRRRLIKYHLTERGSAVPVSELRRSRPPGYQPRPLAILTTGGLCVDSLQLPGSPSPPASSERHIRTPTRAYGVLSIWGGKQVSS